MFDFDAIYNDAKAEEFSAGKREFYDNSVVGVSGEADGHRFKVSAKVIGERTYRANFVFDESGQLYDYVCSCDVFSAEEGPCRHIVAAALTYQNKHPQEAMGILGPKEGRSDAAALKLLKEYARFKSRNFIGSDEGKITLTPVFCVKDEDRVVLKFHIGRNKTYVLKDIADFVSAFNSKAYRRYGTYLEVEHYLQNFTTQSQSLIDFILTSYGENSTHIGQDKRDELPLSYSAIDEIILLYNGKVIMFSERHFANGIRLIEDGETKYPFKIRITAEENGYLIEPDSPPFLTITGRRKNYYITDSRIYTVSKQSHLTTQAFYKTLYAHTKLFLSGTDFPHFYNSVLVPVSEHIEIAATGIELSAFLAPPLSVSLYIDLVGDKIGATVRAFYGGTEVDILSEENPLEVVRDFEREEIFKDLLYSYFPSDGELLITGDDGIFNFLSSGAKRFLEAGEVFFSAKAARVKVRRPPKISIGVRLNSGLLDLDMSAEGYTENELRAALNAYRDNKDYIRLSDGSFVALSDASVKAAAQAALIAGIKPGRSVMPKYYALYIENAFKNEMFDFRSDETFNDIIKSVLTPDKNAFVLPESFNLVMRQYQKDGFYWLKALCNIGFGGILADDMGLGKSIQALSLIASEKGGTSVVVCPTSLILNWLGEIEKFAPDLIAAAVMGDAEQRKDILTHLKAYDIIITSYELLRRDEDFYKDCHFKFAIIDEAQYIKNPDTRNAKSVKSINADYRFALTGTPIENSLSELWSIFDFIMPNYLGGYSEFKEKFESGVVKGDKVSANKLIELVNPFILRRLKSDVLTELPPKTETIINCVMDLNQRKLYLANLEAIRTEINNKPSNKISVLSGITKLRQICDDPALVYSDFPENGAKIDAAMDIIITAAEGGHKILLFSQFTAMLDLIRKRLLSENISYYLLTGQTLKGERMRLVTRFNLDDTKVFLISLKAGGTGLNLTGADIVIHFDPWWNESVMNQAEDRAYRLGQDKSVQVYKLIMKDTIEEKIMLMQKRKKALSTLIIQPGAESKLAYGEMLELLT